MVIALAEAMHERGMNYQQQLHVTAVDIDERAAHMAYVQFSLMHIPATVYVGNTLTMEIRERWDTPAHILGGWDFRLAAREQVNQAEEVETPLSRAPKADIEVSQLGEQLSLLEPELTAPLEASLDGGIEI